MAVVLTWLWSLRNQNTYFVMEEQGSTLISENNYAIGQRIDSLNSVYVYYNGVRSNVSGRSLAPDGYNLGQQYQCVEFVKRYYYEHLNFKMNESSGHAIDFFNKGLEDGEKNLTRGLTQFSNPSRSKPKLDDLIVFNASSSNQYGHVAIVSKIMDDKVEIIQQNPGINIGSRLTFPLVYKKNKWKINNPRILGWLRKEKQNGKSKDR